MTKDKELEIEDKELEVVTYEALEVARKTFEEYLESYGFDPAYWDIKFTAWLVSQDLKERLTRIEIEHEVKDGCEHEVKENKNETP